jgi:hypothetical protein
MGMLQQSAAYNAVQTSKQLIILDMKPSSPVILVLAALFFSPMARCASKEKSEALVAKARSQQVWDERTPALRIKAELGVVGINGTTAQGDYIFDSARGPHTRNYLIVRPTPKYSLIVSTAFSVSH